MSGAKLPTYVSAADPQQGDALGAAAFDAAQSAQAATEEADTAAPADVQLGRTVQLNPVVTPDPVYGNVGPAVDLVWCLFPDEPKHATVVLQTALSSTPVIAVVTTSVGGSAQVQRTFAIPGGPPLRIQTFGRMITVSVFQTGALGTAGARVTGAIVTEDVNPLADLVTEWVPNATPGLASQVTPQGQTVNGYFLGCVGSLDPTTGTAGAAYWVMFFDVALTGLAAGAQPLVALGPLTGKQPSSFTFDRSLRPSVRFGTALSWGVSTTQGTYTPAADGVLARVDADYGV